MGLSAINDQGANLTADGAVDWWFMYKLPRPGAKDAPVSGPGGLVDGFSYLYFDPASGGRLSLSPNKLGQGAGALHNSLKQIFDAADQPGSGVGWLLYNDEIPGQKNNNDDKGHCKGVLAFNPVDDSAVWILHSTPRFPIRDNPVFPSDEVDYAQTFLCITLDSYAAANRIAAQMRTQQDPQVYAYRWPDAAPAGACQDEIYKLCTGVAAAPAGAPEQIAFKSRGGRQFQSIAKNRQWARDFWIDLVGPALGVDLNVESWRRGKIPGVDDTTPGLEVADVGGINLNPLDVSVQWPYTKDHAKWAAGTGPDWVCVADINRQISQEKRGGGSICFQEAALWGDLNSIETLSQKGS